MSDATHDAKTGVLSVDLELCQGHGRCYMLYPDLFEPFDDNGRSRVRVSDVSGQNYDDAQRAVGECPERAITLRPS